MEHQSTLFQELDSMTSPPAVGITDATSSLNAEIAALWRLPVGQRVQVSLTNHAIGGTNGLLELTRLPDLPFDARAVLHLRIGTESFTSLQIINWALVE